MSAQKWVATWGNAISITERKPENYGRNLTLRYPVTIQLDGTAVKIRLDNYCGNDPVTVSEATVGIADGKKTANILPVTFNGSGSVTIEAGKDISSDPVDMKVRRGETLVVSLYFSDFTELRSGVLTTGPLSNGFFAVGNHTNSPELPVNESKKTSWFYFLSEVDVLTAAENRCIICYGDSITAQAWPEYLVLKNLKRGNGKTAFIRKAASGTRILRQYDNIVYDSYGLKGTNRFAHETDTAGADAVIIQHGINDIIHPVGAEINPFRPWSDLPTAEEMTEGLMYYLSSAKKQGMKVYLGTLLPIEGWRTYAAFRENLKNDVNAWIRETAESDGVIDFDMAVRNPQNPAAFAEGFDSGDHLHPSLKAYERMAEEVPEYLYCDETAENR